MRGRGVGGILAAAVRTLEEKTGRLNGARNPPQDKMSGERDLIKPELSVFLVPP